MNWEVRIMKSVMSFCKKHGWFNPTLFWKNVTRFWPIWTIYGLLWFLMIPAELLSRFQSYYQDQGLTTEETKYL